MTTLYPQRRHVQVDHATLSWLLLYALAAQLILYRRFHGYTCTNKVLFRPITVMVPDLVLICENMLMAEGFVQAKTLASKFHGLYSLLQELLSKQVGFRHAIRAHPPPNVALETMSPSTYTQ